LSVGDVLPPERELARLFGVSRTVIREALVALKHDGIIEVRQGSRATIQALSVPTLSAVLPGAGSRDRDSILTVYEVRLALEPEADALAALRATDEDMERIDEAVIALAHRLTSGASGAAADMDIHLAVCAAAHNRVMLQVMESLQSRVVEAVE